MGWLNAFPLTFAHQNACAGEEHFLLTFSLSKQHLHSI